MNISSIPRRIIRRLRKKFFWKTVVYNVFDRPNSWPTALILFVTDAFNERGSEDRYRHTTDWESVQLARILDERGYRVDVVDRAEESWIPEDRYELFVGNGAGNSGRRYPEFCELTPSALHVFYARGAHTDKANRYSDSRYQALKDRTGVNFDGRTMRVMDRVDFESCMKLTDAILTINSNGFTAGTYQDTGKQIETFPPPTGPGVKFDEEWIETREKSKFFCLVGSGFVRKGVDLIVEAFLEMPDARLTIAGPDTDRLFWDIYGERIRNAPNIDYIGFVDISGEKYREICRTHAWTISADVCEGVSTSVATNMRSGLIPVVTYATATRTDDFGFQLPSEADRIIQEIKVLAPILRQMDDSEYSRRVHECLEVAEEYTQVSYTRAINNAFDRILNSPSGVSG